LNDLDLFIKNSQEIYKNMNFKILLLK